MVRLDFGAIFTNIDIFADFSIHENRKEKSFNTQLMTTFRSLFLPVTIKFMFLISLQEGIYTKTYLIFVCITPTLTLTLIHAYILVKRLVLASAF